MGRAVVDRRRANGNKRRRGIAVAASLLGCAGFGLVLVTSSAHAAPIVAPGHSSTLQISKVSGSLFGTTSGAEARFTQMTWGPDGRLYASTDGRGVLRFDYNATTGALSNMTQVSAINGLGIAFRGTNEMYLTSNYTSPNDQDPGGHFRLSSVWRLKSSDGGSTWGNAIPIVQGIPQHDHGANNIQIHNNSLYVGVGVRTRNGSFSVPFWFPQATLDSYGESVYGGSIMQIRDLDALDAQINTIVTGGGDASNVAGFYPANPTAAQYEAYIKGTDPNASLPYTSESTHKLTVHSSGTRNPYGLDIDGDGNIWFSNNFQRVSNDDYSVDPDDPSVNDDFDGDGFQNDVHDQFFRAVEGGDYGYRNDNWRQDGLDENGNPIANNNGQYYFNGAIPVASHTFDNIVPGSSAMHDPADPDGLGPSSSSNGFDIYDGNALPIQYHKKAFLVRWNGQVSTNGQTLDYRDLVMVDLNTGAVDRIASSLANPLAVLTTPDGRILVAEYGGDVYEIRAVAPVTTSHQLLWSSDNDGDWSDYLSWSALADANVHLVPTQWGNQSYDVTIDRPGAKPIVTLDRDALVHALTLGDALRLRRAHSLLVQEDLSLLPAADLIIEILSTSDFSQLVVGGLADLEGTLLVDVLDGADLEVGDAFDVVLAQSIVDDSLLLSSLTDGYAFDMQVVNGDTLRLTVTAVPEPAGAAAGAALTATALLLRRRRRAQS